MGIETDYSRLFHVATAVLSYIHKSKLNPDYTKSMRLYVASGTHISGDLNDRIEAIEDAVGAPEHLFFEGDSSAYDANAINTLSILYFIAPLIALAITIQIYVIVELFGRIVSLFGGGSRGRDREVVQSLKSKYGIDSSDIDLAVSKFIIKGEFIYALLNWGFVVGILLLNWPIDITPVDILRLLEQFAFVGYVMFIVFLGLIHPARDRHFAEKIAEREDEFGDVCAVMGEAHHYGVCNILENHESVQLINPRPENPGLTTQVSMLIFRVINVVSPKSN